ncbi:DUF4333 domain-containing protein [Nocardiopsis sp. CNT-189]|uniref:DUF4333 domain-containing protein n=1 Tax=Nocardiopsis oceanisediminis TaxID=2816862 RepID=UPI003B2A8B0B
MRLTRRNRTIVAGAGAGAAVLLAAGCAVEFNVEGVPQEEVVERATQVLEEELGGAVEDFSCPGELPAQEGESMRCELTAGGQTVGVTLTTTKVNGSDVDFDVKVDADLSELVEGSG